MVLPGWYVVLPVLCQVWCYTPIPWPTEKPWRIISNQSCAECTVILRLRHSIPFHSECIFGVWHTPFRGVEWMLQHALHSMEWVCLDTLQAHSSIWIFPPSICLQFARTNACISKVTTLTTFYPRNLLKRENSNTGMCLECVLTHSLHGMECMLLHTFHSMEWNIQCILHSWSVPGMECVPLRNGHKTDNNAWVQGGSGRVGRVGRGPSMFLEGYYPDHDFCPKFSFLWKTQF